MDLKPVIRIATALLCILPTKYTLADDGLHDRPEAAPTEHSSSETVTGNDASSPAEQVLAKSASPYQAGVADWKKWVASQPEACSPAVDSFALLQGKQTEVAVLLLHGYAINPGKMRFLAQFFANQGMNVIVPRLPGHFNKNIRDLDHVKREEWLDASRQSFKIAQKLGKRLVIVGYSLGGLLASRLALEEKHYIDAIVLLAPAWRVSALVTAGSDIGSVFDLSLNDIEKSIPMTCAPESRYLSAAGGVEVERLGADTEQNFGGSYPGMESSVFRLIRVPHFVATADDDITVNSTAIRSILPTLKETNWFYSIAQFEKGGHSLFDHQESLSTKPAVSTYKGNLGDEIKAFLKEAW